MSATPRPWTVEYKWARAFDGATVYSHIKSMGMGIAWSATPDDADLIVTAVNAYDPQLAAKVAEVRAYIERLRELTRPGCPDPRDDGSACGACRARWAVCDDLDAILEGKGK